MNIRSERQKMLAGEIYNCLDGDLKEERAGVKRLLREFNLAVDEAERQRLLTGLLGSHGSNLIIESPFHCVYGKNIHIGDQVYLNFQCTILDCGEVRLGDYVLVGPAVQIYTAAHLLQAQGRNQGLEVAKPVTIGDNVWIGGGAIILPGVTVGDNAVIGAGAVVPRDVAPNTVVVGNPARVVREIDQTQRL
ncbi:MAG: sugar O-acetyltransferase [Anaerolineales bacterium]